MTHDRSSARHARKASPPRRRLLGIVVAAAAIAGVVGLGSFFTDSAPDDHVTLVPSPAPSSTQTVDDSSPPEGAPSASPTAAATAGPSPSEESVSDDPGGSGGSGGDDGSRGGPDAPRPSVTDSPSEEDPSSDEPEPPRATHPGESPSPDPDPTSPGPSPDPSPSATADPTPEPTQDPEPTPTTTSSPDPDPDPGTCSAVATAESTSWIGFDAAVTITNTSGNRVLGWRSTFTLPHGFRAVSASNAELVESGNSGVVSGRDTIRPGESLTYEISARGFGSAEPPSGVTLNDESCS